MARIDEARCAGCGICAGVCPEGIEMSGGKARIRNEKAACLRDAANACPTGALMLNEAMAGNKDAGTEFSQGYGRGRGMGAGRGRGLGIGPRDGRGQGRGGGGRGRGR
jgi:ferredoxin